MDPLLARPYYCISKLMLSLLEVVHVGIISADASHMQRSRRSNSVRALEQIRGPFTSIRCASVLHVFHGGSLHGIAPVGLRVAKDALLEISVQMVTERLTGLSWLRLRVVYF